MTKNLLIDKIMYCMNCKGDLKLIGNHQEFYGFSIYYCSRCKLIQTYPIPSNSFLVDYYKKEYRDKRKDQKLKKKYIKEKKITAKSQFNFIKNFSSMDFTDRKSILEIGCSIGELLKLFKINGWEIKGVEPDIIMAEYAKKNNKLDVDTSVFKINDFKEKRFDLIALSHVFEHIANPIEFIKEIATIMKSGSILFIEVPNDEYDKINLMIKLKTTSSHLYFYNVNSLKQIFEKNGFKVIFFCTVGIKLKNLVRQQNDLVTIKDYKIFFFKKFIPYIRVAWNKIFHSEDIYIRNISNYSDIDSYSTRVAIRALFKKA